MKSNYIELVGYDITKHNEIGLLNFALCCLNCFKCCPGVNRPKQAVEFLKVLAGDRKVLETSGIDEYEECYEIATVVVKKFSHKIFIIIIEN